MPRLDAMAVAVAGTVLAVSVLVGCSGGHGSSTPTTTVGTTTAGPGGSSSSLPSTSSTPPASAPTASTSPARATTTAPPPPTTSRSGGTSANVRIRGFTVTPSSPVSCNAPTMIQLEWTMTGAAQVTLSIDGRLFASYPSGPQNHLEYFACDGRSHTYTLHAQQGPASATVSQTVSSN